MFALIIPMGGNMGPGIDNSLPGGGWGGHPSQGLPISPGHPGNALPQPPSPWGPGNWRPSACFWAAPKSSPPTTNGNHRPN